MHILVVEDSLVIRTILNKILVKEGMEVTEAIHGEDALEKLQKVTKPNVILLDWHMPIMDGCEFLTTIKAFEMYNEIPVLVITAQTNLYEALIAGANGYITKPFTRKVVLEKVYSLGKTTVSV